MLLLNEGSNINKARYRLKVQGRLMLPYLSYVANTDFVWFSLITISQVYIHVTGSPWASCLLWSAMGFVISMFDPVLPRTLYHYQKQFWFDNFSKVWKGPVPSG